MNPAIKRVIGLALQDVEGGVIERDNGEPTGVLREKALELLKPLTDHEETASQKALRLPMWKSCHNKCR